MTVAHSWADMEACYIGVPGTMSLMPSLGAITAPRTAARCCMPLNSWSLLRVSYVIDVSLPVMRVEE